MKIRKVSKRKNVIEKYRILDELNPDLAEKHTNLNMYCTDIVYCKRVSVQHDVGGFFCCCTVNHNAGISNFQNASGSRIILEIIQSVSVSRECGSRERKRNRETEEESESMHYLHQYHLYSVKKPKA